MIDILRALQWWDEWQLRILVLGSLGLQWFLLLAAPLRNYTIPRLFRFSIWVAYVSADALAIYALATLFNRHSKASSSSSSSCDCCDYGNKGSSLEVLWAPLLLVYLGGREEITAYTIEDNELWTRNTVTMVSQVTVAVYSFYKSWPDSSDRKLLLSAILLFIIGIISFIEKPWALRRASIKRLVAMSSVLKGKRESTNWWDWCFTELGDRYKCWKELPDDEEAILSQGDQVQMILSDLSLYTAQATLETRGLQSGQQILAKLPPNFSENKKMRRGLVRQAFGLIYTRANVIFTPAYLACHVMLVPSLYIAAIMLFATSRSKRGYGATDVKTTYILLVFTAVLDVFGLLISELMYRLMSKAKLAALCENIAGHNLLDSVLRTAKRGPVAPVRFGRSRKELGKGQSLYQTVSDFITAELVKVSERVRNNDFSSYRSFTKNYWSDTKKEKLLKTAYYSKRENTATSSSPDDHPTKKGNVMIWRSLRKMPFDASVLIWHIATDLCFRTKHLRRRHAHGDGLREVCTEAISNYMAYLLNFHPDMLMAGSRKDLFIEATKYMKRILSTQDICDAFPYIKEQAEGLKKKEAYSVVHDACRLAEELLGIEEEDTRWGLMYRMWVGMLCYSASMCRGYLHAKSLGEGGEFLSYVWFIISLMGAKTLSDTLQMPDKEQGDDEPDLLLADQKLKEDQDKKDTDTIIVPEWLRAFQSLEEASFWSKI